MFSFSPAAAADAVAANLVDDAEQAGAAGDAIRLPGALDTPGSGSGIGIRYTCTVIVRSVVEAVMWMSTKLAKVFA